jgi:hypothetical protein
MLNPISFRPGPVTFWTTLVYLALLIPIVIINEDAPPVPSELPFQGVNLTQAWLDLTTITTAYHPYNSHFNDEVRNFLLRRVEATLDQNGVAWDTDGCVSLSVFGLVALTNPTVLALEPAIRNPRSLSLTT